jgi:hypothetical protein
MPAAPLSLVGRLLFFSVCAAFFVLWPPAPETVILRGKVMTLPEAMTALGIALKPDLEPIARQVALVADDGTVTPLFSDDASRALFLDKRLRNRAVEIHGRRFKGVPYLQVITLKIEQEGRLQTPEYFCSVCTISVRYPQTCPCCQGPMELRMKPELH